jgi:hypothetical protein
MGSFKSTRKSAKFQKYRDTIRTYLKTTPPASLAICSRAKAQGGKRTESTMTSAATKAMEQMA